MGSPFSKDYKEEYEQKILWAYRYPDVLSEFLSSEGVTRFWGNYRYNFIFILSRSNKSPKSLIGRLRVSLALPLLVPFTFTF